MEATMHNEFTAILERAGEWYIPIARRFPAPMARVERRTEHEPNLAKAIALVLADRREHRSVFALASAALP